MPPSTTALARREEPDRAGDALPGRRRRRRAPTVVPSGLDIVVRCGLSNVAENVIEPARSAVRRMAITWSGALANTSRR